MVFRVFSYLSKKKTLEWKVAVKRSNTFLELHNFLKKLFGLPGNELASFFTADDKWHSIQEICLTDMGGKKKDIIIPLMSEARIGDFLESSVNRFKYIYDFMKCYMFFMELIGEEEKKEEPPYCIPPVYSLSKSELARIGMYARKNLIGEVPIPGEKQEDILFTDTEFNEPFPGDEDDLLNNWDDENI